jgi:hypothetical protein
MKQILLAILVIGILLLGACGTPTTAPEAEAPPAEQPAPTTYTLSVGVSPSGAGSVSPSSGQYEEGTRVTLIATPASGYIFDYWSGDASGSVATITITMNSDKSVIAHFKAVDAIPPVISEVNISHITESNATINWVTDEPATSQVEYGKTDAYGSTMSLNEELDTSHSVTLTELKPETTYHFRIKSVDEAGNEALSSDYTFTTKTTEELISAILYYPPTTVGGITTIEGEVVVPESYMLRFELFNDSSQTITVTKVEIVDGHGRVKLSFSITPDTVDAGTSRRLANVVQTLPLENWQVKWYCVDAKGVKFTIIGACSSSD